MPDFAHMTFDELLRPEGYRCSCGRFHGCSLRKLLIGRGVIRQLPGLLKEAGIQKPYLVMDKNTKAAAGDAICAILDEAGIPYGSYCYPVRERNTGGASPAPTTRRGIVQRAVEGASPYGQ